MPTHQHSIFAEGTRHHLHLELALRAGAADADVAAALGRARRSSEDRRTNGGVNLVIGLGPAAWERLRPADSAGPFAPFPGYRTPDGAHEAPSTQADVWLWLHGPSPDVIVDQARSMVDALAPVATVELDLPAFVYHDSRDLTGFVDGTANPLLAEAADVATIPPGEPGAGGAYAMTAKYVHDLAAFDALEVEEQEHVFGRTKADSTGLGDAKRPTAHIVRAEVADDDGHELVVYRRSVPFGSATEHGLLFVSFGADQRRFDLQLRRMHGMTEDGVVDALLDYTRAVRGSFWLCPNRADLDVVAPRPTDA